MQAAPQVPEETEGKEDKMNAVKRAARELLADVRRRYPGEELRCPYMRALDAALEAADNG